MRSSVLSCLFILLFISCYQAERNCDEFRTGTFEFSYTLDGKEITNRFSRNDSLEIAKINNTIDTSSVRWINDCEFIVKKLNPKTISEQKAIHIKILSTTADSYTFEYAVVGDLKNKQRGTAKKIN
ncbi:hypothetical protein GWK08_10085 [Leptobacterium flavescens]|uniref:DNA topoisomerase IV n=2 Tax=Leptobacterium flavescens TaxID=472055 RepID=A0A6P0UPM5_9FLAO|nr:hypothetical protein [Leptobacterium flavescens]